MYAPLFTASGLDAIMRCAGAATLPTVEEEERDQALADAGTAEHARKLRPGGLPANLEDWLTNSGGLCAPMFEVRFFVDFSDPASARSISADGDTSVLIGERYGVPSPRVSAGTCDAFAFAIADGAIYLRVADLKTGAGQAAGCLPPARESWQLRYYTLAVLLWLGWPEQLRLGAGAVSFWTRDGSPEADEWRIEEAELNETELLEWLAQLKELTVRLTTRPAALWAEGSWCARCPKFRACPVQQSPIRKLGIPLDANRIGPAEARQVADAIGPARRLVEHAETVLDRYVARYGPLPVAGGRVLYRTREQRRQVTDAALPLLRAELTPEQYRVAVRESTSLARIAEAAGDKAPALLARVQEAGAIEETVTFRLRERNRQTD